MTREEALQFGHGGEPWRTRPSGTARGIEGSSFNSATAVNRGEHGGRVMPCPTCSGFNSATAVNRGELGVLGEFTPFYGWLQFGHGGEPWRTWPGRRRIGTAPHCFNSATAVNRGELPDARTRKWPCGCFNSATAVNRGEPPD